MKRKMLLGLSVLGFLILVAFVILSFAQRVTLVTASEVPVYESPSSWDRQVALLPPGAKVPVTKCVDTKTDIVPRVAVSQSVSGYVGRGKYRIIGTPVWTSWRGPITFSCGVLVGTSNE